MLHWFDEAQFNEQGQFIYTYLGLGDCIATILFMVSALIIPFRCGLTFRAYIYTGKFGEPNKALLTGLMDDEGLRWKYLFTGYHPGGIGADSMVLVMFAIMSVFLWGVYLVAGLVILLAHIMRKRIAHKQEFIGNLKGEQLND